MPSLRHFIAPAVVTTNTKVSAYKYTQCSTTFSGVQGLLIPLPCRLPYSILRTCTSIIARQGECSSLSPCTGGPSFLAPPREKKRTFLQPPPVWLDADSTEAVHRTAPDWLAKCHLAWSGSRWDPPQKGRPPASAFSAAGGLYGSLSLWSLSFVPEFGLDGCLLLIRCLRFGLIIASSSTNPPVLSSFSSSFSLSSITGLFLFPIFLVILPPS